MGSIGAPETPRQKMIMLMYLVLTAMLALNVDKKVLDAFSLVNEGFMSTIENFSQKNESVYTKFNNAAQENQAKAGALNRKVISIKQRTDSLYNYITSIKEQLVKMADGPDGRLDSIALKEELNVAGVLMIAKGKGKELKAAIDDYRDFMVKVFDPSDSINITAIKKYLDTDDQPTVSGIKPSWEVSKFEGYPLMVVITLMSKMQSDIRNSEADAINYLFSQIEATSFKFNKLNAQVIPKSSYVLEGESYEAKVFISAMDTTVSPDILVNGNKLQIIQGENVGLYKATAGKEGTVIWKGVINYKSPSGVIIPYPFQQEYQVAKPSMTVSPTKMNVMYVGLANPVSISVPGISMRDISVSMTNGRIEQKESGFFAYPEKITEKAYITVSATVDKVVKKMGTAEFRVKKAPNPTASVAGKLAGLISKAELVSEQGVFAEIPEFDFDLKFKVLSFEVSTTTKDGFNKGIAVRGDTFSQEQRDLFNKLSRGNRLNIEKIRVKGEDGFERDLPSITFVIN